MPIEKISQHTAYALCLAAKRALIFGASLFVFLLVTIIFVQGDGTAPAVTHVSAAILSFTSKYVGISQSLFHVVVFWSLLVFVAAFAAAKNNNKAQKVEVGSQSVQRSGFLVIGIAISAVVFLLIGRFRDGTADEEAKLAVQLVQGSTQVIHDVGEGGGRVFLRSVRRKSGEPTLYEVAVLGKKDLYAFVEAPRGWGSAELKLLCVTSSAERDPYKHPCEK